ncbi:DUF3857 domain-containing protein [Flavobacterium aciduliphilum]|uniref:Uncharacterized protein DUF3857 n=1 Tax=Flavobacterium aciduliphilum TaxID=1101402 RepID=A0A328YNU0_9FLAO|nr:DUF3857 domain-containing protein [Flavobacterium aciduliphilum]RAR75721.1 uncharacterized protein DUF3857 [Flavobacterium aciduliphilum]
MSKKILLLFVLLFQLSAFSQDKAEIKERFWGANDPCKKTTSIPDKWKNESAVIIYNYEYYDYHKFGTNVTFTSAIRKRIKLLDQAAVTEFSEFSFKDKFYSNKGMYTLRKGTNTIGIKIVKANGKETEIDVDKEAKEADKEKKIAISNLEVGDIIDYYYYSVEPFKSIFEYGFDPEESALGDVYPTMEMKLAFTTENDFFVNFNTYNGAPELKEIPSERGGERHYELVAKDIEKNEFPRWFYPLAELPCYKFQVFFARSGAFEKRADAFLSSSEKIIKKTVSKEDVYNYYEDKYRASGDLSEINDFLSSKNFASDEEKVREVYYFARHAFFTKYLEAFVANKSNIFYPFDLYRNPIFFQTEDAFITYFMAFLKKATIDYDIIVATPRFNGSIDDLLIQRNLNVLLRVNTANPIYLEYFSPFSSADQFNYNLENSKAIVLKVTKGKKISDADTVVLPSSTYTDNVSKVKSEVSLTDDFSGWNVKKEANIFGHLKESEQSDKLYFFDYVNEDYEKYGTTKLLDLVHNRKKQEQYQKAFDALINKMKDEQKETFKKATSDDYGFPIEDHKLIIKNSGRFGKNSPLTYEEDFSIKNNLIKKAGANYLLELGKLITSQIEIDKKEKERKNNIYMIYPRSFENEISFTIPEGYAVSGLEKLNKKIENETGGFVSTATLLGNKLIIKTTKYYKNYFEPNSNWDKMIQFLDGAYQFTQEKILLKKI